MGWWWNYDGIIRIRDWNNQSAMMSTGARRLLTGDKMVNRVFYETFLKIRVKLFHVYFQGLGLV